MMNCKWLSKVVLALLMIAIVASFFLAAIPVQATDGDVVRMRVVGNGGPMYSYWKFSNASCVLAANDTIEYDVYLTSYLPGVGGIEVYCTDGFYFRDQGDWYDQSGIQGHPGNDLRSVAYKKWYHRVLQVPDAAAGRTIAFWDVAVDGNYGWFDVPSAMIDKVCVSGKIWAYYNGATSLSQRHMASGAALYDQMFASSYRRGSAYGSPVQVSSDLFYWYDCPTNNPYESNMQMCYDPNGTNVTGPSAVYGYGYGLSGYYSSQNIGWWEGTFDDMKAAGIDIANLVSWGNHPYMPWFQINNPLTTYMVPALEKSGVGIKISMFDDTSSEVSDWNYVNGRGYSTSPRMDLRNSAYYSYFYDRKIKPFFQAIPSKYWATHNGQPIGAGGRPIIMTWVDGFYDYVNPYGNNLWGAVKNAFTADFGVTPFLILENSWVSHGAGNYADGYYVWGCGLSNPSIYPVNNYYVGTIGPGADNRPWANRQTPLQPTFNHDRSQASWLTSWYSNVWNGYNLRDCALIIEETWNEHWEGTGIDRCVNYTNWDGYADPNVYGPTGRPGSGMTETSYIETFGQKCIENSVGRWDYDATFYNTWTMATNLTRGSTQVATWLRNDGFEPWYIGGGTPTRMRVWLSDAADNKIAGTEAEFALQSDTLLGNITYIVWTTPANWPVGSSNFMRFDMYKYGMGYFQNADGRDQVPKIAVTIN